MSQESDAVVNARATLHSSLERLAQNLQASKSLKQGDVVFRLAGLAGGDYRLECGEGQVRVAESVAAEVDKPPLVEIIGNADTIRAIIDGKKDARKQFLAGGIRVRGDLRYFSDVALELGVLKAPL